MHFHLPKPLHGWREFAGEVGIIVLGVLIALSCEQLAERWTWNERVKDAREAIRRDLQWNFRFADERAAAQPCLMEQLDGLKNAVLRAKGQLPPLPLIVESNSTTVYRSPWRPWRDSVWRSAASDGVLAHFPRAERASYDAVYTQIGMLKSLDDQSLEHSAQLMSLANPLPLDPSVQVHFVEVIESERQDAQLMGTLGAGVMQQATALHAQASMEDRRSFRDQVSGTLKYCRAKGLTIAKTKGR